MSVWKTIRENHGAGVDGWPRVTILHSFYRSDLPSGENATVLRQFRMLAEAGVDVSLLSVHTDDLQNSPFYSVKSARNVALGSGYSPIESLENLGAEVVHLHNLFPNIATDWIRFTKAAVVTSLHNYRPLCAAATLSRNGSDCTLCLTKSSFQAVKYGCYRGSRVASIPLAIRNHREPQHDPVLEYSELLLAPSLMVKRTYEAAGVKNLRVLYQPSEFDETARGLGENDVGHLFLGRLSEEKGLLGLLRAWPNTEILTIVGQGPLEVAARHLAGQRGLQTRFRGFVDDAELSTILAGAESLIFPSTWREGAPAVYAEAMAFGLPVIAVAGNSVAESVWQHGTGLVLDELSVGALAQAIVEIRGRRNALGNVCRLTYKENYTVDRWLVHLNELYNEAALSRSQRR